MRINVEYLSYLLRQITKKESEEINFDSVGNPTLSDLLRLIENIYGNGIGDLIFNKNTIPPNVFILVNGNRAIDLELKLKEGDQVSFFTPVSNG